ncbi:MAG: tetratricopeptide repeat protein [Snowella sp.]|nr:tetratricopeptide repeat protein [Snowella sp.]
MDQARLQAYVNLIEQLLTCADGEELNNIIQKNQELIDLQFLQEMENYAMGLEQQENDNDAAWLRNIAQQLGQFLNPQAESIEEYQEFLLEVLQAEIDSNSDPGVIYPILQCHQHLLNDTFAQVLQQYARNVFSQGKAEDVTVIAKVIGNLCIHIQKLPLGSRANNLEIAITGYQSILEIYTRETFPDEWAGIQNNLGLAYGDRIREERADNLELAIAAYNLSLEVYTREAFPDEWARIQNNLGAAYSKRIRGERADNLELAIAAFNRSLEVKKREAFPENWAGIQNNLGNAYSDRIVGERAENLEKAISAYKLSLEVYTRDSFPEGWARSQNNLGNTYINRIQGDIAENIETAIFCYQEALKIRTFDAFPFDWATTQNNLGNAYSKRIRGNKAENIENAIICYQNALQIYTHEAFPEDWVKTQYNLANTLRERFKLLGKVEDIQQAINAYKQGKKIIEKTEDQKLYFNYSYQLGKALFEGGYYTEAIEHLENCQQRYQKQKDVNNLAPILLELARLYHRIGRLEQARLYFKDSLRLFRRLDDQDNVASVISALGNLEIQIGKIPQACNHLKEAQEYYQKNNHTERLDEIDHLLKILQSA